VEKFIPPIPQIEDAAAALAPFPLPNAPYKVSQYWTFKTSAGDTPTLPVAAFQIFAEDVYPDFLHLLTEAASDPGENRFSDVDGVLAQGTVVEKARALRGIFAERPHIGRKILDRLRQWEHDPEKIATREHLISLVKLYLGPDSRYLNFYGPAQTIPTVPYHEVVNPPEEKTESRDRFDFQGKAVFVGTSEKKQAEQKQADAFYTVFTKTSGLDLSGVEIAATAFANILEDMPVRLLSAHNLALVLLLWGMAMGGFCYALPPLPAALSVGGASLLYLGTALYLFKASGLWIPLVVPLFGQGPLTYFGAVLWSYLETKKEREQIKKAFRLYVPEDVVERVSKNIANMKKGNTVVQGTCLSSDAESYTALSEGMDPEALSSEINRYYEMIFKPVREHGGFVSNVVGDEMFAVWVKVRPDDASCRDACLAALDIDHSLRLVRNASGAPHLPTRIGLHSGRIFLGNIGALDHYEYRPVGDIVNTASRIEGLNKYLRTKILLSQAVLDQLEGFVTRKVGTFLLKGKSEPLVIYELLSQQEDCSNEQLSLCQDFSQALEAFQQGYWAEAAGAFSAAGERCGDDGPSRFYMGLCEQYQGKPPREDWDGVIAMDRK
jgi:adenylate cyclase